ncbi:MAG: HAMP domain-containing protein, partial [Cystobacter sp.]
MGEAVSRGALNQVRVEWIAAAFGLLTGLTMVYVPYEFGTSIFKLIYPYIRWMGSAFLVGSSVMLVTQLYPTWPAWMAWVGRVLFLGSLAVYWWGAAVLVGGITGILVYPVMVATLLAELLVPRWRDRGLFSAFLLTTALAFGVGLLMDPTLLGPSFYPVYRPVARPMGLLFGLSGALLGLGLWRANTKLARGAVGLLTVLFGQMAVVAGYRATWTGMALYFIIALGSALLLYLGRRPDTSSVGWRLFRGVALTSVLPILAVGGLASVFAQKAIERELRDKARQAVEAEIAWLAQSVNTARFLLLSQSQDPLLLDILGRQDAEALLSRLRQLEFQPGPFDAAWILDDAGDALPSPFRPVGPQGNFAHRDYFQHGRSEGEVYLSRPFLSINGLPMVAFSTPVALDGGRMGTLVGGMSLLRMGRELTFASRNYHVEIFDHREGELLRETQGGQVLTRAPVLSLLDDTFSAEAGLTEGTDASGRRLLIAHARVPGTPWAVAVTAPLRQAFAAVTRLSAIVVLIALAAGSVALLLSRWVGRDMTQRLTELRDGFAALGTWRLDQPVPARGDDELAQLTAGFNDMAARIERTQKELREAIVIRDQFMSMASHELRTPLTPLKATIELLLRQSQPGQGMSPE